jgi:hypothetical protein
VTSLGSVSSQYPSTPSIITTMRLNGELFESVRIVLPPRIIEAVPVALTA